MNGCDSPDEPTTQEVDDPPYDTLEEKKEALCLPEPPE
jgi:hypothetical protein